MCVCVCVFVCVCVLFVYLSIFMGVPVETLETYGDEEEIPGGSGIV